MRYKIAISFLTFFACILIYPLFDAKANPESTFTISQTSQNQQEPAGCLCEHLIVILGDVSLSQLSLDASDVRDVKLKEKDKTTTINDVNVEDYKTTIKLKFKTKLKCCPGEKEKQCVGKVDVRVESDWPTDSVKLADMEVQRIIWYDWLPNMYGGEKLDEARALPIQLMAPCGREKTEKFLLEQEILFVRRLTPEEYSNEKNFSDEYKISKMKKWLSGEVTFKFELTCEGLEEKVDSQVKLAISEQNGTWQGQVREKPKGGKIELKAKCLKTDERPANSDEIPKYIGPDASSLSIMTWDALWGEAVSLPLEIYEGDGTLVGKATTGTDEATDLYLPSGEYYVKAIIPILWFDVPAYASPMLPLTSDRPYVINIMLATLIPVKYVSITFYILLGIIGVLIIYRIIRIAV